MIRRRQIVQLDDKPELYVVIWVDKEQKTYDLTLKVYDDLLMSKDNIIVDDVLNLYKRVKIPFNEYDVHKDRVKLANGNW